MVSPEYLRNICQCGGRMKVIAFIEPPQADVIEKILRHRGLWHASTASARPPPGDRDSPSTADGELTYVPIDEFLATF